MHQLNTKAAEHEMDDVEKLEVFYQQGTENERPSGMGSEKAVGLLDFERGAGSAHRAFQRWIVDCMTRAGLRDLSAVEVLVLHHVNHRSRNKRLADICFNLNIEDVHVVNYALRKLVSLNVLKAEKQGKEVSYATTELGQQYVMRYREIREERLMDNLDTLNINKQVLEELAQFLRKMSGLYDQAARAASSL